MPRTAFAARSLPRAAKARPSSDSLEISDAGRLAEQMSQIPDIRQDRVNEIRAKSPPARTKPTPK